LLRISGEKGSPNFGLKFDFWICYYLSFEMRRTAIVLLLNDNQITLLIGNIECRKSS
jgi:hypothetical protein